MVILHSPRAPRKNMVAMPFIGSGKYCRVARLESAIFAQCTTPAGKFFLPDAIFQGAKLSADQPRAVNEYLDG